MSLPIVEFVGMSLSNRRVKMNAVTRTSDAERYGRQCRERIGQGKPVRKELVRAAFRYPSGCDGT
jgi:hypothetical protein